MILNHLFGLQLGPPSALPKHQVLIIFGAVAALSLELRSGVLSARAQRWAWAGLSFGLGLFVGPFNLAIQPAIPLNLLGRPRARDPFLFPLLAALTLPFVLGVARATTCWRWSAVTTAIIAFVVTYAASWFSVLGFAVVFPDGLPGGISFPRVFNALRLLPLLPAIAFDLAWGSPTRRAGPVPGAAVWGGVFLAEMFWLWGETAQCRLLMRSCCSCRWSWSVRLEHPRLGAESAVGSRSTRPPEPDEKRAQQIYADHLFKVASGKPVERRDRENAGIVDNAVETSELPHCRTDSTFCRP